MNELCADPWTYYWLGVATAIALVTALYFLYRVLGDKP